MGLPIIKKCNNNRETDSKRKQFSRREVLLFCLCLLLGVLLLMLLFDSFLSGIVDGKSEDFTEFVNLLKRLCGDFYTMFVAVLCSVISTTVLPRVLRGGDEKTLDGVIDEKIEAIEIMQSDVYYELKKMNNWVENSEWIKPIVSYKNTNTPNPEFNDMLNESINMTKDYIYVGDRALYLVKRLAKDIHSINNKLHIQVMLVDIEDEKILEARKYIYIERERAKNREEGIDKDIDEKKLLDDVKLKVIQSMYALSMLKKRYDIEILLHKEIPFMRFEITDSLLVLSILTDLASGKDYPSTFVYGDKAVFKKSYEEYAKQISIRGRTMNESDLTLEALYKLGCKVGISGCTKEKIQEYYNSIK